MRPTDEFASFLGEVFINPVSLLQQPTNNFQQSIVPFFAKSPDGVLYYV
jgi:hypothetical protein